MEGICFPISYSYSKFLFYSSFSMLLSAIIAIIMNDKYISIYFCLLFLTSINYWRRPEYGLRRNIDLCIVYIGEFAILYQLFLLKSEFDRHVVLSILLCVILFYIIEHILVYFKSLKWIIFHMAIHMYSSFTIFFMVFN